MITNAKNYTKVNIKIRNKSVSSPQSTVSPKLHCFNFGQYLSIPQMQGTLS